ncbi:MAG: DUF2800 domain-containing protein [Paraburkholderia sp.]|uniref:DUF2800 domain-containing protein n=1 Tax=Paraburkholderia sp. TaxID=1926495 RepID=UPI00120BC434|nr:DUF2800 domain-containing protein [Paraburkholderia sp.]TAL99558.1 MAG: DUF2800 domain-containing protein [Paraburkholderia sp.]
MSNPAVQHSTLSFSGRERWAACPGSVGMSVGMSDESSPAAAEGTAAHSVAEFYMRQRFNLPGAMPGEAPDVSPVMGLNRFENLTGDELAVEAYKWNEELRVAGKRYRDFITSLIPTGMQWGVDVFVSLETRVAASSIDPRLFGTADYMLWFPKYRHLIVVDYKYGFIDVDIGTVERPNKQLSAYAIAALDKLTGNRPESVELAVFQPRRIGGMPEQRLKLPIVALDAEIERLKAEVAEVDRPNPKLSIGDHCRYCKGKPRCPKVQAQMQAALDVGAGQRSVLDMPADDLLALYSARTAIKNVLEDVEEKVAILAKEGHARIVRETRQGRRVWADPQQAALTLLALGLDKHLKPGNLSDVLPDLPEGFEAGLVKRTADSVSLKVIDAPGVSQVGEMFRKFASNIVDDGATNG